MKCIQAAGMALIGSVVLLSGCASTPLEPSTEMTKAKSAIDQAERAGAREYATDELNSSSQKMAQGQAAAAKGEKAQSEQLFEESYADAHLAQISAQNAKSAKDATDVDRGIATLQNEAGRSSTP
jgi:Domain of unknown function (DUF4398)